MKHRLFFAVAWLLGTILCLWPKSTIPHVKVHKQFDMKYTKTEATYNLDGIRIGLIRIWDDSRPKSCVIMQYPSSADSSVDDVTVKRTVEILDFNGFGGLILINLSVEGLQEVEKIYSSFPDIVFVAAWGRKISAKNSMEVVNHIRSLGINVFCFGTNMDGTPTMTTRLSKVSLLYDL